MLESNLIPRYDLKRVQGYQGTSGRNKGASRNDEAVQFKATLRAKRTEGKLDEKRGERVKERGKSTGEKGKNGGKRHRLART